MVQLFSQPLRIYDMPPLATATTAAARLPR